MNKDTLLTYRDERQAALEQACALIRGYLDDRIEILEKINTHWWTVLLQVGEYRTARWEADRAMYRWDWLIDEMCRLWGLSNLREGHL